jgi:hypothetical protein
VGGDAAWDLRRPRDFDAASKHVSEDDLRALVPVSSDLKFHTDRLAEIVALGVDELHLLQVGRNHEAFIETFGAKVLPHLRG